MPINCSLGILNPGQWGIWEILALLAVILLVFGARRLPELARSLGRSLSEFKRGREEGEQTLNAGEQDRKAPEPQNRAKDVQSDER